MISNKISKQKMDAHIQFEQTRIPQPKERLFERETTVRQFPTKQPEIVLSPLDAFFIRVGVKEMPQTKTSTSPLEWNSKVLGLIAIVFSLLVSMGGMIWYSASLASDVKYMQIEQQKLLQKFENLEQKFLLKVEGIEKVQREQEIKKAEINGYQIGKTEKK